MIALLYLLGFLSGLGAAFLFYYVMKLKKKKDKAKESCSDAFFRILNY